MSSLVDRLRAVMRQQPCELGTCKCHLAPGVLTADLLSGDGDEPEWSAHYSAAWWERRLEGLRDG